MHTIRYLALISGVMQVAFAGYIVASSLVEIEESATELGVNIQGGGGSGLSALGIVINVSGLVLDQASIRAHEGTVATVGQMEEKLCVLLAPRVLGAPLKCLEDSDVLCTFTMEKSSDDWVLTVEETEMAIAEGDSAGAVILEASKSDEDAARAPKGLRVLPTPSCSGVRIVYGGKRVTLVDVLIFDVNGRLVWRQHEYSDKDGSAVLDWDGKNRSGSTVADGVYLVRVRTAIDEQRAKIVFMK